MLAILFAALTLASLGSAFGYRTETLTRASLFAGFGADVAALGILLGRRKAWGSGTISGSAG